MSKRVATTDREPRKKKSKKVGVRYLVEQAQALAAEGEYVVEMDETDATVWVVYVTAGTLKEQDNVELGLSLEQWAQSSGRPPCIKFEITFPADFPITVPFVRVVSPRFQFHTGHVTIGGSICTEMLTPSAWQPMTIASLLRSMLETLKDGNAKIQLVPDYHCGVPFQDYTKHEAQMAFSRVAAQHGWQ